MGVNWSRKWSAIAVSAVAPFALSGCLILPGEFSSEMTVGKTGDFSFSYKGQIQLVGLASLLDSEAFGETGSSEFKAICWNEAATDAAAEPVIDAAAEDVAVGMQPYTAYAVMRGSVTQLINTSTAQDANKTVEEAADAMAKAADQTASDAAAPVDEWQMAERECTKEEVATQKDEWDLQQTASKKRDADAKKMATMMLGGIDPKDPKTIVRFTKEVERLAAWHKVEHIGNGVFMIDYSTKGKLADDFAFPVIPRYALGEPMIHITRWDNGRMRVEAPAFKSDPEMSMMGLLGAGSLAGMMSSGGGAGKMPEPMAIKGSFMLTTDARILANNTEDGPEAAAGMEVLRWDIGPATYGAPMALLKLAQ